MGITYRVKDTPRITAPLIKSYKLNARKVAMCTAYDYTTAKLIDGTEIDIILVGDSVASVFQGEETTIPVTLEQMAYHCRCVSRGVNRALVVGDLPFLSYQPSISTAIESAGKLLKEGRVSAVKLEGGLAVADIIQRLTMFDIPVMGHVGLTPQSYHRMGGHKIQGRSHGIDQAGSWERIIADAKAVEAAGAFSIVLEGIPEELGAEITAALSIPTIGIGAGRACDGQVLVINDLLGLTVGAIPSFVKKYAELGVQAQAALNQFATEVRSGAFPQRANTKSKTPLLRAVLNK